MRQCLTAVAILVGAALLTGPTVAETQSPWREPPDSAPRAQAAAGVGGLPQEQAATFHVAGQAGGGVLAVAASGDRLYVGRGTRVVVMDARVPLAPVELGRTEPLPGPVLDMAVQGETAFAIAGGLVVIDVAEAAQPRVLGAVALGECCERVVVHQGFAYVWGPWWTSVTVVDVRDPSRPEPVAQIGSGSVNDVALQGNLAVLADGCCWDSGPVAGLEVVDITDPTAPTTLADLDYADFASTVAFHGDGVLVRDSACRIRRVDLTQPTSPVVGGCMAAEIPLSPIRFMVQGDRLHLLGGQNDRYGYWVGDIAPDAVRWRLRYTVLSAARMTVDGEVAWFAGGVEGLQTARIEELSDIAATGSVELSGYPSRVTTFGELAFVEGNGDFGVLMVDLTEPGSPRVIARLEGTGPVAVDGDSIFVAASGGIDVLDLTDPARPVRVGSIPMADTPVALAVMGNYLVVTANLTSPCCIDSLVQTWDIANPAAARPLGSVTGEWSAGSSVLHDGYVYLAGVGSLLVISVLDPAAPRVVATYPVSADALAFRGDTLFTGRRYGDVHALDISDPANPVELWVRSDFYLRSMAAHGDHLWVAHDREDGIRVLDVAAPDGPFGVGLFQPETAFASIGFAGENAVALEVSRDSQNPTPARLHVLDTSKPGKLARAELPAEPPRSAVGVARSAGHVLVADAVTGLVVLDADDPERPAGTLRLAYGATAVAASSRSAYASEPALDGTWAPGHSRVMRIDLGDPAAPRVASEVHIASEVAELHLEGGTLLALGSATRSGAGPSLHWLDVSGSAAPRPVGSLDFESQWIASAALQGGRGYVATGSRLLIADLTGPSGASWLDEYAIETEGVATALALAGDTAYVGIGLYDEGVHILEMRDGRPVREIGRIALPGNRIAGLAPLGDRLVVAADDGVGLWDVADPAQPVQVGMMVAGASPFNPSELARSVTTDRDRVWLAADAAGVVVASLPARDLPVRIALPLVTTR